MSDTCDKCDKNMTRFLNWPFLPNHVSVGDDKYCIMYDDGIAMEIVVKLVISGF